MGVWTLGRDMKAITVDVYLLKDHIHTQNKEQTLTLQTFFVFFFFSHSFTKSFKNRRSHCPL